MSPQEEFFKNAAECSRMAEATRDPIDKAAWLRLAESWQRLGEEVDEPFAPQRRHDPIPPAGK